jgi:membrane-bound inhibitor of C-type lysozyme
MKKSALLVGTFAVAFALGAWYTAWNSDGIDAQPISENETVATYSCAGGKSIWAAYKEDGSVDLSFSDRSDVSLPQAMSASGARYASIDESFVFWNKGQTAFVEEDGEVTYADCVQK